MNKTEHLTKKDRLEELYKKKEELEKQIKGEKENTPYQNKETKNDPTNKIENKEEVENYKRERLQRMPGPEQDYAEAKERANIQYQQYKKDFSTKNTEQTKNDSKNNHQIEKER